MPMKRKRYAPIGVERDGKRVKGRKLSVHKTAHATNAQRTRARQLARARYELGCKCTRLRDQAEFPKKHGLTAAQAAAALRELKSLEDPRSRPFSRWIKE